MEIECFITAWFSAGEPVIYLENGCGNGFSIENPEVEFEFRNRGEIESYSKLSMSSKDLIFENINDITVNKSYFNTKEFKLPTKSSELVIKHKIKFIIKNKSQTNLSLNLNVSCASKVWGLVNKECKTSEPLNKICMYNRAGDWYYSVK